MNKLKLIFLFTFCYFVTIDYCNSQTVEKKNTLPIKYIKTNLMSVKGYTLDILKAMPEETYNYVPTEGMRTFEAQAYHIYYSLDYYIRWFDNERPKWEPGDENSLDKNKLIKLVTEKFDEIIKLVEEPKYTNTILPKLISLFDHNSHHRGQLIVYLRMNKIKPPAYR